eukprot:scaffold79909_cov47-Prasinocladus_malaysianus.AAC.3
MIPHIDNRHIHLACRRLGVKGAQWLVTAGLSPDTFCGSKRVGDGMTIVMPSDDGSSAKPKIDMHRSPCHNLSTQTASRLSYEGTKSIVV